ncbi:MAG: MCD, Malonyl-CoA decarboxylase MCD [Alphaproteobacteria bacterium]|nr:MCD, Malonyl-CoA decarboxylase MCD [Alphaproteobacteria bacterium]
MERSFFHDLLGSIAERGRSLIGLDRAVVGARPVDLIELTEALLSVRGEASGVALAQEVLDRYAASSAEERGFYLHALATRYGPHLPRLDRAIEAYVADKNPTTMAALTAAAMPRRQEVMRRLNLAPNGTTALVRMREDVLAGLEEQSELEPLDTDFALLFRSWFNRGFLVLRRIDWTTPANILEKIIRYEAVHTIQSWDDLRNRIEPPDRRCYAFFHPRLADEPLIFVEVALTEDMPGAIAPLLDLSRAPLGPDRARTAVFYSISNCQPGLKGVTFGHFLIKQVVEDLKRDVPGIERFVTLSPAPGLGRWLRREITERSNALLPPPALAALEPVVSADWRGFADGDGAARDALLAAAAVYFLHAKTGSGRRPIDPVARFHLGNGARLERLNWNGDLSTKGVEQSAGLMVNYLYDLAAIEHNHEAYANSGEVAAGPLVTGFLPSPPRPAGSKRRPFMRRALGARAAAD